MTLVEIDDETAMDLLWKLFAISDGIETNVDYETGKLCDAIGIDIKEAYVSYRKNYIKKMLRVSAENDFTTLEKDPAYIALLKGCEKRGNDINKKMIEIIEKHTKSKEGE